MLRGAQVQLGSGTSESCDSPWHMPKHCRWLVFLNDFWMIILCTSIGCTFQLGYYCSFTTDAVQNIKNPPVTFWQRQIGDLRSSTPCNYCTLAICSAMTWTCQQGSPCLNVVHIFWKFWIKNVWVWLFQKKSRLRLPWSPRYPWLPNGPNLHNPQKRRSGDNSRTFFMWRREYFAPPLGALTSNTH